MGDHISIMDSLVVTLVSMVAVFIILVLISVLISGLQTLGSEKKEEKEEAKPVEPIAVVEKVIQEEKGEISEELVAVISAALASSLGLNIPDINIRSIRRLPQTTNSWGATAIREQISGRLN